MSIAGIETRLEAREPPLPSVIQLLGSEPSFHPHRTFGCRFHEPSDRKDASQ